MWVPVVLYDTSDGVTTCPEFHLAILQTQYSSRQFSTLRLLGHFWAHLGPNSDECYSSFVCFCHVLRLDFLFIQMQWWDVRKYNFEYNTCIWVSPFHREILYVYLTCIWQQPLLSVRKFMGFHVFIGAYRAYVVKQWCSGRFRQQKHMWLGLEKMPWFGLQK